MQDNIKKPSKFQMGPYQDPRRPHTENSGVEHQQNYTWSEAMQHNNDI